MSSADRFWKHVTPGAPDACWEWQAARDKDGYGLLTDVPGKQIMAHRMAYYLQYGELSPYMVILHTCDNPSCVNPAHLRLGTFQDNSDDMMAKERQRRGESHPSARLTEAAVRAIRHAYDHEGVSQSQLATTYGVTVSAIHHVVKRLSWRHVE